MRAQEYVEGSVVWAELEKLGLIQRKGQNDVLVFTLFAKADVGVSRSGDMRSVAPKLQAWPGIRSKQVLEPFV